MGTWSTETQSAMCSGAVCARRAYKGTERAGHDAVGNRDKEKAAMAEVWNEEAPDYLKFDFCLQKEWIERFN